MSEQHTSYTEAPASVTVRAVSPKGYDVMLTLRGIDGGELMPKVLKALDWLDGQGFTPSPVRGGGQGPTPAATNGNGGGAAPTCPTHGQPMKPSTHGGGWYCPVKIADDDGTGKPVYCKCKAK